jgi:hypothetical protein
MISDFHIQTSESTNLTCYKHLQCLHTPSSRCLDWTEICDGKIDCLDGDFDEEHCWQLEINQCKENEYRCDNGQCIPQSFYRERDRIHDCTDGSDKSLLSSHQVTSLFYQTTINGL